MGCEPANNESTFWRKAMERRWTGLATGDKGRGAFARTNLTDAIMARDIELLLKVLAATREPAKSARQAA